MAVDALETPVPVFLPPELLEVSLPGKIPFLFHAAEENSQLEFFC